jgi:hypothetical protein
MIHAGCQVAQAPLRADRMGIEAFPAAAAL